MCVDVETSSLPMHHYHPQAQLQYTTKLPDTNMVTTMASPGPTLHHCTHNNNSSDNNNDTMNNSNNKPSCSSVAEHYCSHPTMRNSKNGKLYSRPHKESGRWLLGHWILLILLAAIPEYYLAMVYFFGVLLNVV